MYHYVKNKEFIKRAQALCTSLLKELEQVLRNEYLINTQFSILGFGDQNMIIQNDDESITWDYNLNVISCPYWNNAKQLKDSIADAFNKIMHKHRLPDVSSLPSSLVTKSIHFNDTPDTKFKIKLCIVTVNSSGALEILTGQKKSGADGYECFWSIIPDSTSQKEKVRAIKALQGNFANELRNLYLDKKNLYLLNDDKSHLSILCYTEAVNELYISLRRKRVIR